MTLAEMVNLVCAQTGYLDADDKAFARGQFAVRDDTLYRMGLWKDSLVQVNLTIDPTTNQDVAEGVIYLPDVIERVVGIRTQTSAVLVSALEIFYRANYDSFNQTGQPCDFAKLHPAWFSWRGSKGLKVVCANAETPTVKIVWYDRSGNRHVTQGAADQAGTLKLTEPDLDRTSLKIVGSSVFPNMDGTYTAIPGGVNGKPAWTGSHYRIIENAVIDGVWFIQEINTGTVLRSKLTDNFASPDLVTGWYDIPTNPPVEGQIVRVAPSLIVVESMFKPTTAGAVSLEPQYADDPDGGTLEATETRSKIHQRVRVFGIPQASIPIKVLGKAVYEPLNFDQQEPKITGSHLALMALVKYDLRVRGDQIGAAQNDLQEYTALLDTLKKEEMQQESYNSRIIPSYGMGPEYGIGPLQSGGFGAF